MATRNTKKSIHSHSQTFNIEKNYYAIGINVTLQSVMSVNKLSKIDKFVEEIKKSKSVRTWKYGFNFFCIHLY